MSIASSKKERRATAAERKRELHAKAEAQAARDALLAPKPVTIDDIKLVPGTTPSALTLRHMARIADADTRDKAREAANAAAKATYEILQGKMPSGNRIAQRYQRAAMAEVKAVKQD